MLILYCKVTFTLSGNNTLKWLYKDVYKVTLLKGD